MDGQRETHKNNSKGVRQRTMYVTNLKVFTVKIIVAHSQCYKMNNK